MHFHHITVVAFLAVGLSTVTAQTDCTVQKDADGNEFGFCSSTTHPLTGESYARATAGAAQRAAGAAGPDGPAGAADADAAGAAAPLPAGATLNQPYTPADVAGSCTSCRITRCRESCAWFKFFWVYYLGVWRPIYHYGAVVQYIHACWCTSPFQICWNWQGRCINKYTQTRLLIHMGFSTTWVYVKYPAGCCCVPWLNGAVGVAGSVGVAGAA